MKSISILMAFASTGVLASAIQLPNLQDRAIDPATMNPTLLSVLSVLKTAMPTGPNAPMPTGDMEPNWYQKLPGDVKSLLPELYPAAAVATSEADAGTEYGYGGGECFLFCLIIFVVAIRVFLRDRICTYVGVLAFQRQRYFSHHIDVIITDHTY
ncbi:hypothetical protein J4E81_003186 [Alternaria sp. BMP 2799]|nr:hypothetical protein J4E81_003186 [Alternaria sp. BMP 2799]